jgi:alpha-galactosidase
MQRACLYSIIIILASSVAGCASIALSGIAANGVAPTPPMGWNSWNAFGDKVDDQKVRGIADALVSSGMRDAGYIYLNIDDTWEGTRDVGGNLQPNARFPDMALLAAYVHSKGLKLGIYSSPGPITCSGYAGSYHHEEQDAAQFADWGIDYLKYDWCTGGRVYENSDAPAVYLRMAKALRATGRGMVFSIANSGAGQVAQWGAGAGGNLWRTTVDIQDSWASMIGNFESNAAAAPLAGPGHWNDPDMLEIGNGGMTEDEYKTQMTLWAMASAPLLAGNDLRAMSSVTESILLNREVIAIDQDPLGKQAVRRKVGAIEIWVKELADGSFAIACVNLGPTAGTATVNLRELHLSSSITAARDLWSHRDLQFHDGAYSSAVAPRGVLVLRTGAT